MNPGLVVKLRPAGPWRVGSGTGARNRVDAVYHSDSLYSAVTSAMARLGSLDEWLDATARAGSPSGSAGPGGRPARERSAVSFSSCFPFLGEIDFIIPPRTVWPPTSPGKSSRVRWKSARFAPLSLVRSILAGRKPGDDRWAVDGPSECLVPAGRPGPFRSAVRWSAAVDRASGAAERHSIACLEFRPGAGLWTVVSFADEAARDRWQDPVKAAFRLLADSGFGGERSRGWGRSAPPEFREGTLPDMILPPVAPAPVEQVPDLPVGQALNLPADGEAEPPSIEPDKVPVETPPAPPEEGSEPEPSDQASGAGSQSVAPSGPAGAPTGASFPGAGETFEPTQGDAAVLAPTELEPLLAETPGSIEPAPAAEDSASVSEPEPPAPAEPEPPAPELISAIAEPSPAGETATLALEPEPPAPAEPGPPAPEPVPTVTDPAPEPAPEPVPEPPPAAPGFESAQPHWLLSLYTPASSDAVDWRRGNYALVTRGGRVESPAASGELKQHLQMVSEGSVLMALAAPGGAAPDVAPRGLAHPVYRAGFAVAIPLPEAAPPARSAPPEAA